MSTPKKLSEPLLVRVFIPEINAQVKIKLLMDEILSIVKIHDMYVCYIIRST